jgi:hypothetical protein
VLLDVEEGSLMTGIKCWSCGRMSRGIQGLEELYRDRGTLKFLFIILRNGFRTT